MLQPVPSRSPTRPPIGILSWVAGWGNGTAQAAARACPRRLSNQLSLDSGRRYRLGIGMRDGMRPHREADSGEYEIAQRHTARIAEAECGAVDETEEGENGGEPAVQRRSVRVGTS